MVKTIDHVATNRIRQLFHSNVDTQYIGRERSNNEDYKVLHHANVYMDPLHPKCAIEVFEPSNSHSTQRKINVLGLGISGSEIFLRKFGRPIANINVYARGIRPDEFKSLFDELVSNCHTQLREITLTDLTSTTSLDHSPRHVFARVQTVTLQHYAIGRAFNRIVNYFKRADTLKIYQAIIVDGFHEAVFVYLYRLILQLEYFDQRSQARLQEFLASNFRIAELSISGCGDGNGELDLVCKSFWEKVCSMSNLRKLEIKDFKTRLSDAVDLFQYEHFTWIVFSTPQSAYEIDNMSHRFNTGSKNLSKQWNSIYRVYDCTIE